MLKYHLKHCIKLYKAKQYAYYIVIFSPVKQSLEEPIIEEVLLIIFLSINHLLSEDTNVLN